VAAEKLTSAAGGRVSDRRSGRELKNQPEPLNRPMPLRANRSVAAQPFRMKTLPCNSFTNRFIPRLNSPALNAPNERGGRWRLRLVGLIFHHRRLV